MGDPFSSEIEISSPPKLSCVSEFPSPTKSAQSVSHSLSDESLKIAESEIQKQEALKNTLRIIDSKPRFYIGVPKSLYYLVEIIQQKCGIPKEHILLCL